MGPETAMFFQIANSGNNALSATILMILRQILNLGGTMDQIVEILKYI